MSVDEQLAKELHKPVFKNSKKRKIYPRFKDNIWAADLAEIGSLSLKNKNVTYFYYVLQYMFSLNMHGLNL